MNVTVTHLKAPWPAGAVVGSVVSLPFEAVPAYFVGKCTPAEDDAEVTHRFEPVAPTPVLVGGEPDADSSLLAEALRENDELKARLLLAEDARAELDGAPADAKGKAKK